MVDVLLVALGEGGAAVGGGGVVADYGVGLARPGLAIGEYGYVRAC